VALNPFSAFCLAGNGDGTFQAPETSPANVSFFSVAVAGDLNGDGNLDLIHASQSHVEILFGNGNCTFQTPVDYTVPGSVSDLAIGDFNGDGNLDFVVANSNIQMFLGTGGGACAAQPPLSVSAYYVTVADLNGDGRLDIVIVSGGQLQVLLGNGDGTFAAPASYSLPTSVGQLVAGDFNGDGFVDVAVSRAGGVSFFPGDGSGNLGTRVDSGALREQTTLQIQVGDFDGTNKLSVMVESNSAIYFGKNTGNGVFVLGRRYVPFGPVRYAFADFNNDGRIDTTVAEDVEVCPPDIPCVTPVPILLQTP
jgi:hypothetical protein